ncbi:helicase-associated domain-containing protein [Kineosporia sp. J2-2]|uniref:Helicase-associated domain-containing protein n=1 Tax=Kineosporia corallincola TaxID=2835133 RepID=A0ABS5TAJ5_9ACTN|nr:helicase-associated domain-containing protein [Kineosporia corallincola]MBT0767474.1 helicase-associated domain-containing protein [Kineosporia corallincola]
MPPTPVRSLADELRSWDDEALVSLLEQRPDLTVPPPADLGGLATAAVTRLSVQRAVDGLDARTLQVLEVMAVSPEPVSSGELSRRWGAPVSGPLAELRGLGLVWGGARSLHLVRAARESLGPHPAGLGPPLAEALGRRSPQRLAEVMEDLGLPPSGDPDTALARLAGHLGDPAIVAALLEKAPQPAAQVLERLVWGPPVGQVPDADRAVRAGTAGSPVEWLLAHGLLAVADPGHVVLPREIGLALRGGRVHRRPEQTPPPLELRERKNTQADDTAGLAAAEAVRLAEALGTLWGADPPPLLRAGGLSVRDLRRTATALDLDEATAALLVEIALAAGLIADDGEADPSWLPTAEFDTWLAGSIGERWVRLALAWWDTPRAAALVGSRGPKDSPVSALGPGVERPQARIVRQHVLTDLAAETARHPEGTVGALADPNGSGLVERLVWTAPRRGSASQPELVRWALTEAAWLGLTGLGAISSFGRSLIESADGAPGYGTGSGPEPTTAQTARRVDGARPAAGLLDGTLPEPVDHVLLQADLSVVAPGRLPAATERELLLMAEVESRGGASVFRITPASVRRALDAGRTGEDLIRWLGAHSRTPVPQPLEYLITDSARRYGRLRVGVASAYLRADDETLLTEVLADRRAAALRLRRLAPTVLAAGAPPDLVLAALREMGLAPAAESPDGDLLVHAVPPRRARAAASPVARRQPPPTASAEALRTAVRAMRAVEQNVRRPVARGGAEPPPLVPMDPAGAIAVLREAAALRRPLWIGYLEDAGKAVRQIIEPLAVEGGRIRALEVASGRVRGYSVHRVIAVAATDETAPEAG